MLRCWRFLDKPLILVEQNFEIPMKGGHDFYYVEEVIETGQRHKVKYSNYKTDE